ncbi:PKD-like family lipoprotein [Butyricimonas virosa]|uniref:PKD-like family lipoprotein n=1 Tax=Butyricimonas virosa TaxID=544645 RepID=UPI002666AB60|nr:PKD-like family lipoprotein [Butyricimonas virosa]
MKIIIKLLSFLIILNFISCYDDKGNYDYEKINDITIEFPDFSWQQIIGETLKVYPKLKYAFNDSTDLKLKFEWSFADRVIGKERQLEWTVDTNVQSDLVLRVTNLDNNLTYMQSKTIRPTSIYTTDKSYLVLSEKNGKSLLSFIQYGEKLDENGNYIRDELGRVILEYKVLEDIYYKGDFYKLNP